MSAVYYGDFEEWQERAYDYFEETKGDYPDSNQDEWLRAIWEEYNEDGYIDWDNHSEDSAWYMYMTEVLDYSHEDIEQYM